MALRAVRILNFKNFSRSFSSASAEINHQDYSVRRTNENSASLHSNKDLYKFYQLPEELKTSLFELGGIPRIYSQQTQYFNESAILIRDCMLELVGYFNKVDLSKPCVRFVLYGKKGTGKSLTLMHALQYAHENNFLIVHIPWALKWFAYPKEVSLSTSKEGQVDLNIDAAMWLRHFQKQNKKLLSDPKMITSKEYIWSPREKSEKNISIEELIEHGISRVKYACDVVDVLLKEIKRLSKENVCRTFVCIDGYNTFFTEKTNCTPEDKSRVLPSRVTLTQSVLDLVQNDWNNGIIVLSLSLRANLKQRRESILPLYILKKEGFESIDPFIPIHVPEYNPEEFNNTLNYFQEKQWLQKREGREEIEFVTKRIPQETYLYCAQT